MATTIANAAILFTVNAAGVAAGLKGIGGAVSGLGASFGAMGAVAAKAFAVIAPVIAVGKLLSLAHAAVESIDRLDELSIKTGVSTEALSRLGYAASFSSLDIETVSDSLNKMQKSLNEASGKEGNIFSALGLDVKKLISEKPDEAFGEIADKINALPTATDRASAALNIFGKSGANLLPFLAEGSAGLKKLGEESDKFGNTIAGEDAIKVAKMNDSLGKLGKAFQGFVDQVVIQAAPLISALLDKIIDWLKNTPGIVNFVTTGFEVLFEAVATGADDFQLLNSLVYYFQAAATEAFGSAIDGITDLADALNYVLTSSIGSKIFGGFKIDTSELEAFSKGLHDVAGEAAQAGDDAFDEFKNGTNAATVHKFFDELRAGADKAAKAELNARNAGNGIAAGVDELADRIEKIHDIFDKLQTSIDDFGLTDNQKILKQLDKLGASGDQIAKAKALTDQLDKLNANKSLDDEASKVIESIQTPAEKAAAEIAKLDTLLDAGKLTWEQYQLAVDKANEALDEKHKPDTQAPELFEAGSQKLRRLSLDLTRNISTGDPQITEIKKSNVFLDQINKNVKAFKPQTLVAASI